MKITEVEFYKSFFKVTGLPAAGPARNSLRRTIKRRQVIADQ